MGEGVILMGTIFMFLIFFPVPCYNEGQDNANGKNCKLEKINKLWLNC